MELLQTKHFFRFEESLAGPALMRTMYPWEILPAIGALILELGETLDPEVYEKIAPDVWVAKTAEIFQPAYLHGPAIIGPHTQVRPGAFIRGNALVGSNCVVGNSTELKNVILFNNVQVPHFNYVGDAVLGYKAHMGAGAVTSNVKQDKSPVTVYHGGARAETGLKKFGAILGDEVEVGCNAVLNPGSVLGRGARVYPLTMVRGFVPAQTICKNNGEQVAISP